MRLAAFVIFLLITLPAAAEPVFPPGLRVGLEPAGDLKTGPGFSGFRDQDRKVSVAIAELPPGTYNELARTMFGKTPAGATKITRELFPFRDGVGYLHSAHAVDNGVASRHWVLLAVPSGTTQNFAAVINVSVPDAASKTYPEAVIRKMLASLTIRKPPIEERLGLIPFKLEDLAGFRVMRVTPGSVLLIDGPDDDISRNPYMIVSISSAPPAQLDDRARFSRDLLATMPFRELTLQSADEMRINSWPGFEIRARAKDPRGNAVSIVQWVRFAGSGFVRIIGTAPVERWDEIFTRFRAVRDGIELR